MEPPIPIWQCDGQWRKQSMTSSDSPDKGLVEPVFGQYLKRYVFHSIARNGLYSYRRRGLIRDGGPSPLRTKPCFQVLCLARQLDAEKRQLNNSLGFSL